MWFSCLVEKASLLPLHFKIFLAIFICLFFDIHFRITYVFRKRKKFLLRRHKIYILISVEVTCLRYCLLIQTMVSLSPTWVLSYVFQYNFIVLFIGSFSLNSFLGISQISLHIIMNGIILISIFIKSFYSLFLIASDSTIHTVYS